MKKIINNPVNFVNETLSGIYHAHSDKVRYVANDLRCLVRKNKINGKVGIVTGGGSGHLPLFLGYVGDGMLDGCAVGGVFQSPNPEQIFEITKAVDGGAGVIYAIGNYNGDIFNFELAASLAEMEARIHTETIIVGDDVASASTDVSKNTRRGIAGIFYVFKCIGAAASLMKNLEEVRAVGERVCRNVRTMGVALKPCIIPELGKPSFTLADDEMEIGMGIHGEPGISRSKILTASEIAPMITLPIIDDLKLSKGDKVSILINGLGATPLEEQYILFKSVFGILKDYDLELGKVFVGEYATSMEMGGVSVSLLRLDEELEKLITMPADTVLYQQI